MGVTYAKRMDGIKFIRPQGSLFLWVELPRQLEAVELLKNAWSATWRLRRAMHSFLTAE